MRQVKRSRIYAEWNNVGKLTGAATRYMRQAECSRIYAEASNANMFAAVQASSNCECRKARIYLQIEFDKAIPFALPRREQYMWPSGQIYAEAVSQLKQAEFYGICGKWSAAEYTETSIEILHISN